MAKMGRREGRWQRGYHLVLSFLLVQYQQRQEQSGNASNVKRFSKLAGSRFGSNTKVRSSSWSGLRHDADQSVRRSDGAP